MVDTRDLGISHFLQLFMSKSKMNNILTVLFLLTKVFITLSLCNGNQSNTIEIKPNKPLKEIRIKRSTNSNKIQALLGEMKLMV